VCVEWTRFENCWGTIREKVWLENSLSHLEGGWQGRGGSEYRNRLWRVTYTRIHITILLTNNQSSFPWYIEPKLSVTKIPSHKNWNFSSPSSRTMDTALNRYGEPWNRQHGPPRPMINPHGLHTYRTSKQHMATSAECWPNTTSKVSPYHLEKYSTTFHSPVKDALGLRTPGVYSIPCECGRVYIGQSGRTRRTVIPTTE